MLHHLRRLRPLLGPGPEYRLRRLACAALPGPRPAVGALFHCCVWKTGSQWVRLILSDPRFYLATGLKPEMITERQAILAAPERFSWPAGRVVTNAILDRGRFDRLGKPEDWRAFFVMRDPRALLVSAYLSNRYSHRPAPLIAEMRAEMSGMDDEAGLLYTLDRRFDGALEILRSWAEAPETRRVRLVRFEDLTGAERLTVWEALLEGLGAPVPRDRLAALLAFYRLERLRGPAEGAGREAKYAGGGRRDWRDWFTPAIAARYEEKAGGLAERLGYGD